MPSITGTKTDLIELAERPRVVAEAIKRLPADQVLFFEERKALCKEVKEIAAQLRGKDRRSQFHYHFP
jgi:hypothetical protein